MQTIELGRTGQHVSRLALGAMQWDNATPASESERILDRYLDAGGAFVDTADCYEWWARPGSRGGHSEELLGRLLRGRRDKVFLATKGSALPRENPALWAADGTPDWDLAWKTFAGAGREALTEALDGSLRRLGTDHVDLYYVHVDDRSTPLEETLETLAGFVTAGKVRYLGWSNVRTWRLERIRQLCLANGWPLPVAVQQEYSYLRPGTAGDGLSQVGGDLRDYLAEHRDQTLVAYSPILKGAYDKGAHYLLKSYEGPDTDARLAVLAEVAAELGVSRSQLVIAWMLHGDNPAAVPLIGPRTYEQFEQLLAATEIKLSADQRERLG